MDGVDFMRKAKIIWSICNMLIVIFLIGFIFALLWYRHGSFEMIPTVEQQEKTQITAIALMIVNGVLCGFCIAVQRACKIISSSSR